MANIQDEQSLCGADVKALEGSGSSEALVEVPDRKPLQSQCVSTVDSSLGCPGVQSCNITSLFPNSHPSGARKGALRCNQKKKDRPLFSYVMIVSHAQLLFGLGLNDV